jgi:ABC-type Na+ efflux pump permease subunit
MEAPARKKPKRGVLSLRGIAAALAGAGHLNARRRAGRQACGWRIADSGRWCGIIRTLLIVLTVAFFLFGALLFGARFGGGPDLQHPVRPEAVLIVLSFGFGTFALVGVAVSRLGRWL